MCIQKNFLTAILFALFYMASLGMTSQVAKADPPPKADTKSTASVSELLPFAEPKYNRVLTHEQNASFQKRLSTYVFKENTRLKEAIVALAESQTETEKQTQWDVIVDELHKNRLVPDVFPVIERLPEADQILFVGACGKHPYIMQGRMEPSIYVNDRYTTGNLSGYGCIRRLQFELLETLLLRGDFQTAEKMRKEHKPRFYGDVVSECWFEAPILIFRNNPEIKTLADYYRFLDESWGSVGRYFKEGLYMSIPMQFSIQEPWVPREKWACIAIEQTLFGDYDLALESANKIEHEEHRHLIVFFIAMGKAFYGDIHGAIAMWEKFPAAMFDESFIKVTNDIGQPTRTEGIDFQYCKRRLFLWLLLEQMRGGVKAGPVPAEIIISLLKDNEKTFAFAYYDYLFANEQIETLCDALGRAELLFSDQYDGGTGGLLCHYARKAYLFQDKKHVDLLLAKAFEIMRNTENLALKREMMYALGQARYDIGSYDHPDAFTREELQFTNPKINGQEQHISGSFPWFVINEEERVMREHEIKIVAGQTKYSKDSFFEAAANTAIKHDQVMALISTGKGLAKTGETELALAYYRQAMDMSKQVPEWNFTGGLSSVYSQIAQSMVATEVNMPFFEEILRTMPKPKEQGQMFLYHSSMRNIAVQCIESQNEELFEKMLGYIEEGEISFLKSQMESEKNRREYLARVQAGEEPPRKRQNESVFTLPEPESEFDFTANEFVAEEGWRSPLTMLLKKMPTPAETREAVRRVVDGESKQDESLQYFFGQRMTLFRDNESTANAIARVKNTPSKRINQGDEYRSNEIDFALRGLAYEYVRRGRLDDALTIMESITHDVPKADALFAVAFRAYDLADTPAKRLEAEKLFDRFEQHQQNYGNTTDKDKQMDVYFRDERYCAYVIRLAQRGMLNRAESCLAKISLPFQNAESVYTMAMAYALEGDFEKSLLVAQTMRDVGTGSFTSWYGEHADGIGPQYSKLQTMTSILSMAASGKYGSVNFQSLDFVDQIEANDVKINLLLAIVSRECTTNLIIGRSFLGLPFSQPYDVTESDGKPLLKNSELAKMLLHKAFELTCDINDVKLRDKVLLEVLPFLVDARMSDDAFEAARLIDTSGDYTTEQKASEYSHSTKIPSHIASVVALLIEEKHSDEALVLCRKVIDWVKPLQYIGDQGGFWPNQPNDTRCEVICHFAEFQAKAGSVDAARQTLAKEHSTVDKQAKKGPYLQRIAEALAKIGDRDAAQSTYVAAISTVLGDWPDKVFTTPNDQYQYFDKIVESYCNFVKPQ